MNFKFKKQLHFQYLSEIIWRECSEKILWWILALLSQWTLCRILLICLVIKGNFDLMEIYFGWEAFVLSGGNNSELLYTFSAQLTHNDP